ncbi:MAG: hypothetical protein H6R07_1003 [Proteobacteria bacterium]|nr:hypothetical protein [Pseudomonadota bacterium]
MEMTVDWNHAIFFKTEKALEELADRRHGLRPKARQLLVMLDGERTLGALTQLISAKELRPLITELRDNHFIGNQAPASPPATATTVTAPATPPAVPEETPLDPVRLTRAKAYLIEISQQHLGLMAAKLQQEIATASDHASMRAALAHWNMALRESRSGASIASQCLQQARELLGHTG